WLPLRGWMCQPHHTGLSRANGEPESLVSTEHTGHGAGIGCHMKELIDEARDVGPADVCEVAFAQLLDPGFKTHGVMTLFDSCGQAARSSSRPNPGPNQTSPLGRRAKATMDSGTSISSIAGPPSWGKRRALPRA